MTAPDTTIEPPKKIFDALDMIDIWLYNAHQIDRDDSIKIPRGLIPRGD